MRLRKLMGAITVGAVLVLAPSAAVAQELPPANEGASARLDGSPRHGEWVKYEAGMGDSVTAWIVYPERSENAPVVVVIHEIFGLTDWIRSVADQLAADGFIAIAPDLLSGKAPGGGGSDAVDRQTAVRLVRELDRGPDGEVVRRLDAAVDYATSLPAARSEFAAIGFCWGGSTTFLYATAQADLDAAVVFYGSSPPSDALANIEAPVLAHYGGDDARVNATIAPAEAAMRDMGKPYEYHIYDGAGHGFLRQQDGRDGANMRATRQAWPRTLEFLRDQLGEG